MTPTADTPSIQPLAPPPHQATGTINPNMTDTIERHPVSHEDMGRLMKMAWALLVGAFALGLWVATIQLGQLQVPKNGEAIELAHRELVAMEKWKIAVDATRYSLRDRADDKARESDNRLLQEKRLQRLEDTQIRIEKSLENIADSLSRQKTGPG